MQEAKLQSGPHIKHHQADGEVMLPVSSGSTRTWISPGAGTVTSPGGVKYYMQCILTR